MTMRSGSPFTRLLNFVCLVFLVILLLALSGCESTTSEMSVKPAKRIRVSGSNACLPLLRILAKSFEKKHPDIEVAFLPGAHSSAGVQSVVNGSIDIGAVSRELKPEEKSTGISYRLLSSDALVIATNQATSITDLTSEQVKSIYGGAITNWKEVGGPDRLIVVLDRAEDESAKIILRKYMLLDLPTVPNATVLFLESDMVKGLESTPFSIGYLSLGYAISEKLPITIISIDGVRPTVSAVHNNKYNIVRPMGIVYKGTTNRLVNQFLEFVQSEDGMKVMEDNGYATAN